MKKAWAGVSAGLLAFALVSCGGGGGGGGGTSGSENTAVNGLASYSRLNVTLDPTSVTRYTVQVDLIPFNSTTYDPASISTLRTTSVNLQVPNGSTVFGQQRYSLQNVTCSQGGSMTGYSAVMLFDRSGSMLTNDPADDTLAAAREFVNRKDRLGQAWIGAFPGGFAARPTYPVTFYGSGFTSDNAQLLANIAAVGAPDGNTPLWDSMIEAIFKFSTFSAPPRSKSLLTFSDGQDNVSSGSPATVLTNALQRSVTVFAINLRNTNSQDLDAIALATGGAVYSTDDAKKLIAFYGTLGTLLSGGARTCSTTIAVEFVANPGVGEVGYGPGGTLKNTLQFDGTSGAATPVLIETQLNLPLYPGRRIGRTLAGRSVYETDLHRFGSTDCVQLVAGPQVRNNCTAPIWLAVCNTDNGTICNRGVVQPGQSIAAFARSTYVQCAWIDPLNRYESLVATGTAPDLWYSPWNATSPTHTCVNTARGPF